MLRKTLATLFTAGALMLVTTACSGREEEPDVASANGGAPAASAPAAGNDARFQACLLEQGVDINKLDGVDAATVTEASKQCKDFAPGGGELPKLTAGDAAQIRAFAKCMRDNGFPDFPDPGADGSIPADYAKSEAEREQMMPTYQACLGKL